MSKPLCSSAEARCSMRSATFRRRAASRPASTASPMAVGISARIRCRRPPARSNCGSQSWSTPARSSSGRWPKRSTPGREEQHVDPAEARAQLNDRIRGIFDGKTFETVPFPGGPFDVPDEVGDARPKLVVFAYDGLAVGETVDEVPELVERVYANKAADGSALRALRNHLVFVAADEHAGDGMRRRMRSRLALQRLKAPDRLVDLAGHQQEKIRDLEARSQQELAIAIQQCYRHVFYPSRNRIGKRGLDLAHTAIHIPSASNQPGAGQQQVARALRDLKKLRLPEDQPDPPDPPDHPQARGFAPPRIRLTSR